MTNIPYHYSNEHNIHYDKFIIKIILATYQLKKSFNNYE